MSDSAARQALKHLVAMLEKDADADETCDKLTGGLASPSGVFDMDTEDLIAKAGISRRTAEAIDLVDELTRRVLMDGFGEKPKLDSCAKAGAFMHAVLHGRHVEYCYAAYLDKNSCLIRLKLLQRGTLDSSNIYVRDVVQEAVRTGAHGVILAHNHPAGTLRPSNADVEVTRACREALAAADVSLKEHVIVTKSGWVGIIEEGYLK